MWQGWEGFAPVMLTIHCWRSLTASQRMPVLAPDASAQVCNAWTKASVFTCLTTQKSWGLEAVVGGRKSWGQTLWIVGRCPTILILPAVSLVARRQPRAIVCGIELQRWYSFLHNMCSHAGAPTGLDIHPPVGVGVARPGHLIHNPPPWVFHRIWFLSSWSCSWSRAGLTMGWCSLNFRLGPSCWGMAMMGAFAGGKQLGRQIGSVTLLLPLLRRRWCLWANLSHHPALCPPQIKLASLISPQHVGRCCITMSSSWIPEI